jgi:hypothetical protein
LKAHRTLEFARRLSGEASSPVQDPLGNHEKDLGLILEHRYLRVLPAGSVASTVSGSVVSAWDITYGTYIVYIILYIEVGRRSRHFDRTL